MQAAEQKARARRFEKLHGARQQAKIAQRKAVVNSLPDEEPTIDALMSDYKRTHKKAAVQMFSTEQPDIYIFG